METIFKEVIELYNEAEYEKIATVIILLLFIILFRCFQKVFVQNHRNVLKNDRQYKKTLIGLLRKPISQININDCYTLTKYASDEKKLSRIEYYIRTNNIKSITNYIKEELFILQDKEFTKYEGPESAIKIIASTLNKIKIKDYIIFPAVTSFLVIYICIVFLLCIANVLNSIIAFFIIIALMVNSISCVFSFSITMTDRYIFDAWIIKLAYYFPMIIFVFVYPECMVALYIFELLTIIVFIGLVIILRKKSSLVNVTSIIEKKKGIKYSHIKDFLEDEDVEQELIIDKSLKTFAFFENYTFVALFQIEEGESVIKNKIINKAYEERIKKSIKKHIKDFEKHDIVLVAKDLK